MKHDTLIYVTAAIGLYLLSSIWMTAAFVTPLLTDYEPRAPSERGPVFSLGGAVGTHITAVDIHYCLFSATVPLALALLTYMTIARPLKKGKTPSKPWNLALAILGYVFALVIGGVLLSIAYYKIHD